MQTSGPFNLALNTTTRITVPSVQGGGQQFSACVLTNMSPFVCQVTVLGASYAKWLVPGVEELVPMNQLVTEIDVTPQVATTPIQVGATAVVTATWIDQQSPALQDTWPNSSGLGGVITAFQQGEVNLGTNEFTLATSTFTYTIPANSPPFSDLLVGYINATGGDPVKVNAFGANSGINYMPLTTMQQGNFLTVPFSSVADPGGITLRVTYFAAGVQTASIQVIGLVYPTTVRPYYGTAGAQGPTNYAQSSGPTGTTLIPGGSVGQVIRIWSMWVTGSMASTAVGAAEVSIQVATGGILLLDALTPAQVAGVNGTNASSSISHPGGLPVSTGISAIIIAFNTTNARAGIAYSYDSA